MVLDKCSFPRPKTCAGWITPRVLKDLQINKNDYPHSLSTFTRFNYYLWGRKIPVRTRQYGILRYEFDHWLMKRSEAPVVKHPVKRIYKDKSHYIIHDQYQCKYLVGAYG